MPELPTTRDLFDKLRLGPIELRNRFIRAAAFEGLSAGHRVTDQLISFHRELAIGGVGLSTVAYAAVEQSGLAFPHQLWMRPEILSGLRTLTDVVRQAGALASIQLGHTGNMSKRAVCGGRPQAPSALPNLYGPTWPRAMGQADIARVVASFGQATRLARDAGFAAVEIHAGHGYLISQFLSPYTNRRSDDYGGSFANRSRFLCEVIAAVLHASDGKLAVLVKSNLEDGFEGGMPLNEGVQVAELLQQLGVHGIVLSGGFVSRSPMFILRGSMPMRLMGRMMSNRLMGVATAYFGKRLVPTVPYDDLYFLPQAQVVRDAVQLPLIYVGGVTSEASAQRVLSAGFDGIAMARALLEQPDLVARLQRGDARAIECDHCNYCSARIYTTHAECKLRVPPPPDLQRLLDADTP